MRIGMAGYTARLTGAAFAFTVAVASAPAGTAQAAPGTADAPLSITTCPALYALGIQGTGESSPDAAPTTDTGMLSTVFRPMLAAAPEAGLIDRAYVPYEASFGGAVGHSVTPYSESVSGGLTRLRAMAAQIGARCPDTRLAVVGYSQGAHVASLFAQEVGAGAGAVPADRVAAVALFSDPTRAPGAPLYPGAPQRTAPDTAPGTAGTALAALTAQIPKAPAAVAPGGGIGPERDLAADFGSLTGRVASFCVTGDLACDAPSNAPLLRAVANLVGQVQLSGGDPIGSLTSIAEAMAYTSIKTATAVATEDITGDTLANLSVAPRTSISRRLSEASDPRTPLDLNSAYAALLRFGVIGLNAVSTAVRTVLTPASLNELATATLADPASGLALLSSTLAGAVAHAVPPTTGVRLVNEAYAAVTGTVADNRELLDVTTWVRYWNTTQRHGAYNTAGRDAPTHFVAAWFAAAARDAAAVAGPGTAPVGGSDAPGTGIFAPNSGASPTSAPPGTGQFPFGAGAAGASAGAGVPPAAPGPTSPARTTS